MQATIASPGLSDPLVAKHFNNTAQLYVDHALECYRTSVAQRLDMLARTADLTREDPIALLDVGCGGGAFLDLFLDRFTQATATGVDISTEMLASNLPNARKHVLVGDALALPVELDEFDAIAIDTVMHHLIAREGYHQTIDRIRAFLLSLHARMRPSAVLVIREIYHEFRAIPTFGSRAIYEMTTTTVPSPIARVMRSLGLQTANVGVCFLTRAQWLQVFAETGFTVAAMEDHAWPGQPYRRFGFQQSGDLHFVLTRTRPQL